MKKYLLVATLTVFSTFSYGQELSKNYIDQNYIEVIGTADKEIVPNEIYLQIFINEKDNKGKETLEQLETNMIKKLQEIGLDVEEQLAIKDLGSKFQFYFLLKTDVFSTKEYEVLVYDAQTAGKVIVELESLGISNISINRVDHSELDSLILAVKQDAIRNAQKKAEALADALEQQIGKAIHIQELDEPGIGNVLRGQAAGIRIRGVSSMYGSRAAQPNINFQKIKIGSKVHAKFVLD